MRTNRKSKNDVLALINKVARKDDTQQLILFDLPKPFGNIERDILWRKLYEAGLPLIFATEIETGRDGTKLIPKYDGYIGTSEDNNTGVSQCSPLSAALFIIYAEQMMKQYRDNFPEHLKGGCVR